jgi:hypothetical protein
VVIVDCAPRFFAAVAQIVLPRAFDERPGVVVLPDARESAGKNLATPCVMFHLPETAQASAFKAEVKATDATEQAPERQRLHGSSSVSGTSATISDPSASVCLMRTRLPFTHRISTVIPDGRVCTLPAV